MRALVALTVSVLCACSGTPGADGGTDGGGGSSSSRIDGSANAVAVQGDKVLIAGSRIVAPTDSDFQLVRVFVDGGLDTSFGTNGRVTQRWPTFIDPVVADAGFLIEQKSDDAYAVTLQGTKILVVGTAQSQGSQSGAFAAVRYSADGVLDTTFGTDGKAQVKFGFGGPATQVALGADGKIYLGGFVARATGSTNNTDFGLARFSADGVLDTTFNTTGAVQGDFGKNEQARGLALQGNKVLAGGGDDFAVARYNDDGSLDMTFGTNGLATSVGGFGQNLKVLAAGQILVAGAERRIGVDQPWDIKLVRYTADGQLDAMFGVGGVVKLGFDEHQVAVLTLDELGDGRLVLAMSAGFGTTRGVYATAARLTAAGALDASFGTAGISELLGGLPLLGNVIPASSNHGVVANGRLHYVDTNTFGNVFILYGSVAL